MVLVQYNTSPIPYHTIPTVSAHIKKKGIRSERVMSGGRLGAWSVDLVVPVNRYLTVFQAQLDFSFFTSVAYCYRPHDVMDIGPVVLKCISTCAVLTGRQAPFAYSLPHLGIPTVHDT